jgi:hypothetical protein
MSAWALPQLKSIELAYANEIIITPIRTKTISRTIAIVSRTITIATKAIISVTGDITIVTGAITIETRKRTITRTSTITGTASAVTPIIQRRSSI